MNKPMRTYILPLIFLFLTAGSTFAAIPNPSTEMRVTATVAKFCSANASPLTFGHYVYDELGARINVTVQCTAGTEYYIGVNQPAGGRSLVGPGNQNLRYVLYQDAGRTRMLGNSVGQNTIYGVGTGTVDVITIYGLIDGEQSATPGYYTDNLNITLSF